MDRRLKQVRAWERTRESLISQVRNPAREHHALAEQVADMEFKIRLILAGWQGRSLSRDAFERLRALQNNIFKALTALRRASR